MAREVKTQSDKIEELQADARANDQHEYVHLNFPPEMFRILIF